MGEYLEMVNRYKLFIELTGGIQEISPEEAAASEPTYVWTEKFPKMETFLSKGYQAGGNAYFKSNNPWGSQTLDFVVTTVWFDCEECESNMDDDQWSQEDCLTCDGSGSLTIDIPECLDAQTEEEIIDSKS